MTNLVLVFVSILIITGFSVIFMVSEFNIIRRGHRTYNWIHWLWDNIEWIRKVRW